MILEPDTRFEAFAEREPYFAVLTAPRFLAASRTPGDEREFFATGETLLAWMFQIIDAGLTPGFAPASTLEYGCGIGRLAIPLARRPGSVTAVDRSPAMLAHARREAAKRGLDHISFETTSSFVTTSRKFDLVVCYHVLQRMRPADGLEVVHTLLQRVAPSGVAVFQWPYRSRGSKLVAAARWTRDRVPGVNAVANRLRGKPARDPFIPTYRYALPRVLPIFDASGFRATHVVLEDDGELGYATVFAQRHARSSRGSRPATHRPSASEPARIDEAPVDRAVTDEEISLYNRTAETYFAALTTWDHHLAKPFSLPDETPALLANFATVLQMLRLSRGLAVVDFGAGTGWLSRALTQLGCRTILVDVSATALDIARELFRRQPPSGDQPAPSFLTYDGRRLPLEDASVDRVVCFDAFHHAPDPAVMIREFARVLKPGGRAVFAEPGPRHADAPRSQFEAQTYGVVENDVDVHAIGRVARRCGFADLKMSVFHEPEHLVSLDEYEDLLAGGPSQEEWLVSTRRFLHNVRNFVLIKSGDDRADSRTSKGLACEIRAPLPAATSGQAIVVDVAVTNTGSAFWLPSTARPGGVSLGAHLYDANGALLDFDYARESLTDDPREIPPGESVARRLTLPALGPGRYTIEIDCVAEDVTWFALAGSRPARLDVDVDQA